MDPSKIVMVNITAWKEYCTGQRCRLSISVNSCLEAHLEKTPLEKGGKRNGGQIMLLFYDGLLLQVPQPSIPNKPSGKH